MVSSLSSFLKPYSLLTTFFMPAHSTSTLSIQTPTPLYSTASLSTSRTAATPPYSSASSTNQRPSPSTCYSISSHLFSSRTNSVSETSSPASSRPTTPLFFRWSSNVLTKHQADSNGFERTTSRADSTKGTHTLEASQPHMTAMFG